MVSRFANDRQRAAVMRKYNRSMGQFTRHHGMGIVGSDVKRIPYFKVVDNIETLLAANPLRKDIILAAGRKIAGQKTIKEQDRTYIALLRKLRT